MTTPPVDGETLLARLNAIFTEDPAIGEIGLLFGIEAEDLTVDDAFQFAEHKLGVAFSAGPIIFRAARTRFHALNAALSAGEIAGPESDAFAELLACTRAVLCISADFYTAWNTRKAFVDRGWLLAADEVAFTSLVFSLHPKSIDTWAYRRWLATRLVQELEPSALTEFFDQQVATCTILAERAPRNYHAWSFRHWLVSRFNDPMQLERELVAMQAWCETHLKDHSGWNHRQHVLKCLLQTTDAKQELLVKECAFLSKLLAPYPMYEALWCHRRFVMQSLLQQAPPLDARDEANGVVDACDAVLGAIGQAVTTAENQNWLQHQFATVQASLVDDPSSVLRSLLLDVAIAWRCGDRFARRYAAWLVQRLLTKASVNANATAAIDRVGRAMRASLATDDVLLDHLWRATA